MYRRLEENGKLLALTITRGDAFFFFGTKHVARTDLSRLYPRLEFCFLRQVHGRSLVAASPAPAPEGDAHYTKDKRQALVVQSADCIPILLAKPKMVCAIHAGWRGIALDIVGEVGKQVPDFEFAAVGPHIFTESFEIGADVKDQLVKSTQAEFAHPKTGAEGKFLFDLKAGAGLQLRRSFGEKLAVEDCSSDTFAGADLHSYRRDGQRAGRQYSFVVLNP